jgi:hypothetical protein
VVIASPFACASGVPDRSSVLQQAVMPRWLVVVAVLGVALINIDIVDAVAIHTDRLRGVHELVHAHQFRARSIPAHQPQLLAGRW